MGAIDRNAGTPDGPLMRLADPPWGVHRFAPPGEEEIERLGQKHPVVALTVLNPSATRGRGRMWAMVYGGKQPSGVESYTVQLGNGRAFAFDSLQRAFLYVMGQLPFPLT